MDRRWRRARALGLAVAASVTLAADVATPIRAMLWLSPQADPMVAVATEPTECLRLPDDPGRAHAVEVGRAAFRTPTLLGGQAARARLTCESCHRAGRGNPDFQFPGASGPPGTADVTTSLFSSHRGNAMDDPRPIPDLTVSRGDRKVPAADLSGFIHGLIVEEFDGPEPSPAVLAGLTAYVLALDPEVCPQTARSRVTLASTLHSARRALMAARIALRQDDRATTLLMIAGARAQLGLVDERYTGLATQRARLRAADGALADLQAAVRAGHPDAAARLANSLADADQLEARLGPSQTRSLFDPARLYRAANARLPPRPS